MKQFSMRKLIRDEVRRAVRLEVAQELKRLRVVVEPPVESVDVETIEGDDTEPAPSTDPAPTYGIDLSIDAES
jgi:hypothetical protein